MKKDGYLVFWPYEDLYGFNGRSCIASLLPH